MSTSLINTKLQPFNATAYHNGDFVELTEKDVLGKYQSSSSPSRFHFRMSYRAR